MISYECPECGEELMVPASLAGEVQQCPVCGVRTEVPPPQPEPQDVDLAALTEDLNHPNADVRVKAVKMLAVHSHGDAGALQMLAHKFRDRSRDVRDAVIMALLEVNQPHVVGMLVRELGGHWSSEVLLREAVFDLIKFGPPAAPSLLEILDETNHNPRKYEPQAVLAAVILLGELAHEPAIPLLAKMFRRHFDLHVRDEAANAMAMIGLPDRWKDIKDMPAAKKRPHARTLAKEVMAMRNVVP